MPKSDKLAEKIQKGLDWFHTVPKELLERERPDIDEKWYDDVIRPVRKGIRNNILSVVEYLEQLPPEDQLEVYKGIEYGLEDQKKKRLNTVSSSEVYDRAMRLYRKICTENNRRMRVRLYGYFSKYGF